MPKGEVYVCRGGSGRQEQAAFDLMCPSFTFPFFFLKTFLLGEL